MSQILENLFLGKFQNAEDLTFLKDKNITHIVTVANELIPKYPDQFIYLYIPVEDKDEYNYSLYFDQIADFIHDAIVNQKGQVLVHCYWGINRSASAVIGYLIKYHNMDFVSAFAFTKQRRKIIFPNFGFRQLLTKYQESLSKDKLKVLQLDVITKKETLNTSLNEESAIKEEQKDTPNNEKLKIVSYSENYQCVNCHVVIFKEDDIVKHGDSLQECSSYFINRSDWNENDKDIWIFCKGTSCSKLIGKINISGKICRCGKKIISDFEIFKDGCLKFDICEL